MDDHPDLFLCHNSADKAWTRELGSRLEAESIDGNPASRRIRVFFDEWDIKSGDNLPLKLGEALKACRRVATVMSPEFFDSGWTALEWTNIVALDPANRDRRLVPIRRRDASLDNKRRIELPPPFNALKYIDFRGEDRFEQAFLELLGDIRDLPNARGGNRNARYDSAPAAQIDSHEIHAAERVDEVLISNLAPVESAPSHLYLADAKAKDDKPVPESLSHLTFRYWDGKLVTFADLEDPDCGLNSLIDPYTIKRISFDQCLVDTDLCTQWLALANKVLERHLTQRGVGKDEKGRFYFWPDQGKDREVGLPKRKVAAKKLHHVSGDSFWVHYSAGIRFTLIAGRLFLRVSPSYKFTSDGHRSLNAKSENRFRMQWGSRQGSAPVLRSILFWLAYLSDEHETATLQTGGEPIRFSVMPGTAVADVGIHLDHIRIKALVDEIQEKELDVAAADAPDPSTATEGDIEHEESADEEEDP